MRRNADIKLLAKFIIDQATEGDAITPEEPPNTGDKSPAAIALERLGGLKGGKTRAESLSAKKRSEFAKRAAAVRWAKKD